MNKNDEKKEDKWWKKTKEQRRTKQEVRINWFTQKMKQK